MLHPARISSRSIMLHILQPYVVLWFCRVCQTQLRLMLPKIQLSALCSRDHVHGAARRSALRRCADMYVCVWRHFCEKVWLAEVHVRRCRSKLSPPSLFCSVCASEPEPAMGKHVLPNNSERHLAFFQLQTALLALGYQ